MRNKNAIIYARRSTGNQEYSIEVQISACSEWALKNNYTVVETVIATISGLSKVREKLEYVINRARTEDMVIIVNTSERITRRIEDIERLEQLGLDLFRICEFELDAPPPIALFRFAITRGAHESLAYSERVKQTYAYLKSVGRLNGWGMCTPDKRKLALSKAKSVQKKRASEVNLKIQEICRQLEDEGYISLSQKARRLNSMGITSRRGKQFTKHSLNRVLNYKVEIETA